jgi:uncharacterized protein (TIGR00730 family)
MTICVFGASSDQINAEYIASGEKLGKVIADRGHGLVFGGGANGLMGAVARGVYKGNGYIMGVAPSFFDVDGVLYEHCSELIYTETMRQRKQVMEDRSDAFIMTPGGIGTFEEFFEILTLKQLGRHTKPIAIFNVCGYYNKIIDMIKQAIDERFMRPESLELCEMFEDPEKLLDYFENYKPSKNITCSRMKY